MSMNGNYTCSQCGMWVSAGTIHSCVGGVTTGTGTWVPGNHTDPVIQEMRDAIKSIAALLQANIPVIQNNQSTLSHLQSVVMRLEQRLKNYETHVSEQLRMCPQCDEVKKGDEYGEDDYICSSCRQRRFEKEQETATA